ncbi:MAG: glycosyltransferase [Desulfobacterales bacterium]
MKIIVYCQHVLGLGHFFRTLEICKALKDHQVILVTGGEPVDVSLPAHMREVRLPALMMDAEFSELYAVDPTDDLKTLQRGRLKHLAQLFRQEKPDIFWVELYPFGRKAFRFELDPLLQGVRRGILPPCRVICSLRDILVEKPDPEAYAQRVLTVLNREFQALLVHADPRIVRLEETFPWVSQIQIPLVYTGFVAPAAPWGAPQVARHRLGLSASRPLVVASAGGGQVGGALLAATIAGFKRLQGQTQAHLEVFTGPYLDSKTFDEFAGQQSESIRVRRFTADFPALLRAADLSVSMAGYNTCMNLVAAGIPALVYPFAQNHEQRLRSEKIAQTAPWQVLSEDDLSAPRLAELMARGMAAPRNLDLAIALNGAGDSARWLAEWVASPANSKPAPPSDHNNARESQSSALLSKEG